ncbi:MAG: murein biosynthesis integral membrane protein MurJ, partial [Chloroflexia bacterium]|nr:murein biosynthesis integral membrane protein MurJ [Chloroflexia bacterium]
MTETAGRTPPSNRGAVARAAGIMALGNVLSRVLGLARESTITHFFGATGLASIFALARQIPQSLYDLLIGGHISAALVPVFSEYTPRERRAELWSIASTFFNLAAIALALAVLLLELVAPGVIRL